MALPPPQINWLANNEALTYRLVLEMLNNDGVREALWLLRGHPVASKLQKKMAVGVLVRELFSEDPNLDVRFEYYCTAVLERIKVVRGKFNYRRKTVKKKISTWEVQVAGDIRVEAFWDKTLRKCYYFRILAFFNGDIDECEIGRTPGIDDHLVDDMLEEVVCTDTIEDESDTESNDEEEESDGEMAWNEKLEAEGSVPRVTPESDEIDHKPGSARLDSKFHSPLSLVDQNIHRQNPQSDTHYQVPQEGFSRDAFTIPESNVRSEGIGIGSKAQVKLLQLEASRKDFQGPTLSYERGKARK